jgi:hypothetical protein
MAQLTSKAFLEQTEKNRAQEREIWDRRPRVEIAEFPRTVPGPD